MHYKTYLNILNNNPEVLDKYKRGYVVRVKPSEYFEENGKTKKTEKGSKRMQKPFWLENVC